MKTKQVAMRAYRFTKAVYGLAILKALKPVFTSPEDVREMKQIREGCLKQIKTLGVK